MKVNKEVYWYYFKITIFPMAFFIILGFVIWSFRYKSINENEKEKGSEIIQNIIREQTKKNLILTPILIGTMDSSQIEVFKSQIIDTIASILYSKYYIGESVNDNSNSPTFFTFSSLLDKDKKNILDEEQLTLLQNHLNFLTKQVETEVDRSKDEINNDIDRLNNWVTIWVGIIGFFGIFIPIIISIDTTTNLQQAKLTADIAIRKIEGAEPILKKMDGVIQFVKGAKSSLTSIKSQLKDAKDELDERIGTIDEKVTDVNQKLSDANNEIDTKLIEATKTISKAESKAKEAFERSEKVELIQEIIYAITKLINLTPSTLANQNDRIKIINQTLNAVHSSLNRCKDHYENDFIKRCIEHLKSCLLDITRDVEISSMHFKLITDFIKLLSEVTSKELDATTLQKVIEELKKLIEKID